MLLTSDHAFGFGQQVTGGAVSKEERRPGGLSSLAVHDIASLKTALATLNNSESTLPTLIILAPGVYDFRDETQQKFLIKAKNVTLQTQRGTDKAARLINFQLDLDLASIDNILIQNLAFHSDGHTRDKADCITLTADGQTASSSSVTNRVRISHCTFDGYRDEAIEIRSRYSRLLATIDHCYFFDSKPGKGNFANRGAINIASVILADATRTTANSFVTVAFNYFENYWRRSPRAASDGTHAHVFNNLLYRWGFQADGLTDMGTWNGMETELDFHQTVPTPGEAVTAVIQASRFIPWESKQNKVISVDTGTKVDIGSSTDLANRFDMPNGKNGNTTLAATVGPGAPQTVAVNAWYTSLGLQAPSVAPTKDIDWVLLARRAGAVERAADSIPNEVAADPRK